MQKKSPKKYKFSTVKDWPDEDKPREKLLKYGEHTLTNSELLAVILQSGTKGENVLDLSRKILKKFKSFRNMSHIDIDVLKEFKGLGKAKISQIKATLEIARRFNEEKIKDKKNKIKSSKDVVEIFSARFRDLKKEIFKVIFLDSNNRIINVEEVAQGTVNFANPIAREIFHKAFQNFASSVICIHNHPSGKITPSTEDRQFTENLVLGSNCLGIKMLDHIIIGDNDYFSFNDNNLI